MSHESNINSFNVLETLTTMIPKIFQKLHSTETKTEYRPNTKEITSVTTGYNNEYLAIES